MDSLSVWLFCSENESEDEFFVHVSRAVREVFDSDIEISSVKVFDTVCIPTEMDPVLLSSLENVRVAESVKVMDPEKVSVWSRLNDDVSESSIDWLSDAVCDMVKLVVLLTETVPV